MKRNRNRLFLSRGATQKRILDFNPVIPADRKEPEVSRITIISYNQSEIEMKNTDIAADCRSLPDGKNKIHWINVSGLKKRDVEEIGNIFSIHPLIIEDILSAGQRPKMDEMENLISALLYSMYVDSELQTVEMDQVSVVLGKNIVISFQESIERNFLKSIENKLQLKDTRLRNYGADYLFNTLIDIIVDNYFFVLERMGEKVEILEDDIIRNATPETLGRINSIRKEMLLLKRNIAPVRELVNGILRSESDLIDDRTDKYFKDIYDHIVQASDLSENYRDMVLNLHDLYLSELNLKMNEVMKVMAIVTCLLAPATVIGGIFGMNFDNMPWLQTGWGFYLAVAVMLFIPIWMIYIFKKRGWF